MVNQKPLPPLPLSSSLAGLSADSRKHRARLLKHFLTDIHEPGIESRRDGWVYVFEEVLDELSQEIGREDWLSSIRRGRWLKQSLNAQSETITRSSSADGRNGSESEKSHQEQGSGGSGKEKEEVLQQESLTEATVSQLKRLQALVSRPAILHGEQRAAHLLLCIAPHGSSVPLPLEDAGFDILPANIGCTFASANFVLRSSEDGTNHTVLYGLEGLEGMLYTLHWSIVSPQRIIPDNVLDTNLRLVGGTFSFKGVNSPMQHMLLSKVLRLGVYVQLSLILEQHLFSDSGVEIKFVRPKLSTPSPSTPNTPPLSKEVRSRSRNSLIPSSFASFLKRGLSYRSQTINPFGGRGGSLDLTVLPSQTEPPLETAARKSFDGLGSRLNRFSFLGERRNSLRLSRISTKIPRSSSEPFVVALRHVDESRSLLSTSPGIALSPPRLLVELAEKDRRTSVSPGVDDQIPKRRLKGDERVAITSLLGWDGKDSEGRGMCGILGFVRQQEISVLCSMHVPIDTSKSTSTSPQPTPSETPVQEGSSTFSTATTATSSTKTTTLTSFYLSMSGLTPCGKPHWLTYQYYANKADDSLGDWVHSITKKRNLACVRPGCKFTQGEHETRVIHDGIRIVFRVSEPTSQMQKVEESGKPKNELENDDIEMWTSCAVCSTRSSRKKMGDGT